MQVKLPLNTIATVAVGNVDMYRASSDTLARAGFVVKKRFGPLEQLRPEVIVRRTEFVRKVRKVPIERLVFIYESGLNLSMARTHAWVKKGQEYVERTPMNWGGNLTLLGAIHLTGWVTLSTVYAASMVELFIKWLKNRLLP